MAYKRQVAYLDYMEFGEKKGSGGFCKWEHKNGLHTMEISLNASRQKLPSKIKVYTRTENELGEIRTDNGRAFMAFSKNEKERNWNWEFSKIKMVLDDDREFIAEFPIDEKEDLTKDRLSVEREKVESDKAVAEPEAVSEAIQAGEFEAVSEMVQVEAIQKLSETMGSEEVSQPAEADAEMQKDVSEPQLHFLWDLLVKTRKLVKPFGTEAEYYSIMLEDISLLKQKYHLLRNNPFLLHGYYNYKYLILGRKEEGSNEYWLGVPGIYHEREKMAARMYGFEKFEGAKPHYRTGDKGYYLITVE